VNKIAEEAEIVERTFQRFHDMQTKHHMDAIEFNEAKKELRDRLEKLTAELDQYTALEYGIDIENRKAYVAWRNNHQPFHWFADFYKIMQQGGFDVVIGNPPYVQYKDVKSQYTVRNFATFPCADLYAFVTEKSYVLTKKNGRIGLIIPISIFGVDGFVSLQKETLSNLGPVWVSSFANRPSQLFDGSQKRLTILLGFRSSKSKSNIFTSRYYRWFREERDILFRAKIEYIHRTSCFLVFPSSLEKVGSSLELETFIKIASNNSILAQGILSTSSHQVFYTRKFGYFLAFLDVVPQIIEIDTGIPRQPSELKSLSFGAPDSLFCAIAGLSSSTFFWFWNVLSDCRNLNRRDILAFPLYPEIIDKNIGKSLTKLGRSYINALKRTSQFMRKSGLEIETFGYAECKHFIDEIDTILAQNYGLTNDELDFVINYDIKYRIKELSTM
jgi:hypothetical protein